MATASLAVIGGRLQYEDVGTGPAVVLTAMMADYPGQHWLALDPHLPDAMPPIEMLAQVTMPALVMAGELDVPGFLGMTDVPAQRLPAAERILVPNAGQMVNMEQPTAVTGQLLRFLRAHGSCAQ